MNSILRNISFMALFALLVQTIDAQPQTPQNLASLYELYQDRETGLVYELSLAVYGSLEEAKKDYMASKTGQLNKKTYQENLPPLSFSQIDPAIRADVLALSGDNYSEPIALPTPKAPKQHIRLKLRKISRQAAMSLPGFANEVNRMLDKGLIPSLETVKQNPLLKRQWLWANVVAKPEALATARSNPNDSTDFATPNVLLADYSTPLSAAIVSGNVPFIKALLAAGANPNQCARMGCPLEMAHYYFSKNQTAQHDPVIDALLQAGANPDAHDQAFAASQTSMIANAAFAGDMVWIDRLAALSANLNTSPKGDKRTTPLVYAALSKVSSEATIKQLLRLGADPLQALTVYPFDVDLLDMTVDRPSLHTWLQNDIVNRAAVRYPYKTWIVQDGKRHLLTTGRIHLKAAPFTLEAELGDRIASSVLLASSLSSDWFAQVKKGDFATGAFGWATTAAQSAAGTPDARGLTAYEAIPKDWDFEKKGHVGGNMILSIPEPSDTYTVWDAVKSSTSAGLNLYSKQFDSIVEIYADYKKPIQTLYFKQLKGKVLHLTSAYPLATDGRLIHINPQYTTLEFE
jgi:hypothetical protein